MIFLINALIFIERFLKNILHLSRINYSYDFSIFIRFCISTKDIQKNIFVDAQFE